MDSKLVIMGFLALGGLYLFSDNDAPPKKPKKRRKRKAKAVELTRSEPSSQPTAAAEPPRAPSPDPTVPSSPPPESSPPEPDDPASLTTAPTSEST